jgi:hypothetical protein
LLSYIAVQLYSKNPGYLFHCSTTKIDLAFLSKLPRVAKHSEGALGALEISRDLLAEIERRKKLLLDAGARDVEDYNSLPGVSKLNTIFWISDELSDVRKALPEGSLQEFDKNIGRISITGRFADIKVLFAMQATNMSLLGDQAAEFRSSFTIVSLNIRPQQEVSIF